MIDFIASQKHYIDHIAPVWNRLPLHFKHNFYTTQGIAEYAKSKIPNAGLHLFQYERSLPQSDIPILVCSYGDLIAAEKNNPSRNIIYMEHGTGHAFGTAAYPNGIGKRDYASLFLAPNIYTEKLIRSVRDTRVEVIGTPKMDIYEGMFSEVQRTIELVGRPSPPTIAIAFHWGDRHALPPESGSAWEHYREILPELHTRYKVIAHGHPLAEHIYKPAFQQMGIEWVSTFNEVLLRADLYINDLSSTLYEFVCTGKPVIILNAPWFRKDVHWGIRFWEYSDVGINVNEPDELFLAIDTTLNDYGSIRLIQREKMVADLYPYIGVSAQRAVNIIEEYLSE